MCNYLLHFFDRLHVLHLLWRQSKAVVVIWCRKSAVTGKDLLDKGEKRMIVSAAVLSNGQYGGH